MDVSIIIVNYNTRQMTSECIDSVFEKTTDVEFEVILVDNASTDGSKECFEKDGRIKYIYSNENLGFGKANNLGLRYAKGKYLFLLNSDTLLLNNAVKIFFNFAEVSDNKYCFWGSFLYDKNRNHIHSYGYFPSLKNLLLKPNIAESADYSTILTVDYITGADLFIRRDTINKYGLFDPDFFMYFEETELQYRYNKKGYLSMIIPDPQIMHLCPIKPIKHIPKLHTYVSGKFTYAKKIFNPMEYVLFRFLGGIVYLFKSLFYQGTLNEKLKFYKTILSR